MRAWEARLSALGKVVAFDYPYMAAGRRAPDPLPKLIQAHREAIAAARKGHKGAVVLIGKSMGSRVGCHVSLEEPVQALVCLGYPLKGAKGALRDEVLLALRVPVLFVQGSRDPLCPLDALERVRRKLTVPNELAAVEDGNHSLQVPKGKLAAAGQSQDDVDERALGWVKAFVARYAG
jgi:hypothetical protein